MRDTPSADDVRALARSSPWLWTSLHLVHRDASGTVEAWLRKPDLVRVRRPGRPVLVQRGDSSGATAILVSSVPLGGPPPPSPRRPHVLETEPVRRPDGLVLSRVTPWEADHDELMWQDYRWVAMLDPLELASGVGISDVRSEGREGRETWWARMVAVEGYEPRCGCCPLLWSRVSDEDEHEAGGPEPVGPWPSAYDVGLDRATGIVVSVQPVDVLVEGEQSLEVSILEVDGPVEE